MMLDNNPLTSDASGRFSLNFWNKEGFEVVESFIYDRSESMQSIMRFMSEMAKREEDFVLGIEKLLRKVSENIKEGESVHEVWKTFAEQIEINLEILIDRISKIRTEICMQLEAFDSEHNRIVKRDFAEIKKLFSEFGFMQSHLIKARGKYNQASQVADMTARQLKNSQGDIKLIAKLEKEKLKSEKAAKLAEDAYKDAVEKLNNFHPQFTKRLTTLYDELQAQELCRMAVVARSFRFYVDCHRAGENWVINMRRVMENVFKNINTLSDMNKWIKKNRKGLHPPCIPIFQPFDEPEKPTAPKPSHRLSIITERERKFSQSRSENLLSMEKSEKPEKLGKLEKSEKLEKPEKLENPEKLGKLEKSDKSEKSEKSSKSFGKAFVKGKAERGNSSIGHSFTLGQRLSKSKVRVDQQSQTETKQTSNEQSPSQDKKVSFGTQIETKFFDPIESEKTQEEEYKRDTLEDTIAHLEQELLGTDVTQQNTNKDPKKEKIYTEIPRDTVEVSDEAPTLGWIRVIFDYEATADDELPLQEGDIIRLLDMHESGWWTGELNGVIGLFPGNHVEITYVQ